MSIHCVAHGWQPWSTPLNPGLGEQFRNRCEAWDLFLRAQRGMASSELALLVSVPW